jgi:hypothetical protein
MKFNLNCVRKVISNYHCHFFILGYWLVGHLLRVRLNEPGQHDLEYPTSISFCLFVKNIIHNSAIK